LATGRDLAHDARLGQIDDGVQVVVVGGHHQVPAVGREKSVVQMAAYIGDGGDGHARFVEVDDPDLARLLERDHEDIGEGRGVMMPASAVTFLPSGSTPASSSKRTGSSVSASRITIVRGT
jgi:hypothetical protein